MGSVQKQTKAAGKSQTGKPQRLLDVLQAGVGRGGVDVGWVVDGLVGV